jgi:predicted negative regulator of RcsB-dependent stress response
MARNRETVLQNEDSALETYRVITSSTTNTGGAEYYSAIQAAARILTKRQEFDEAMKILDQVDAAKLGGSWSPSMWLARGETLAAAGQKEEALEAYRAVLKSDSASKAHREKAEAAIQQLE